MTHKFFSKCSAFLLAGILGSSTLMTPMTAAGIYDNNNYLGAFYCVPPISIESEKFSYAVNREGQNTYFHFQTTVPEVQNAKHHLVMLAGFAYDADGNIENYYFQQMQTETDDIYYRGFFKFFFGVKDMARLLPDVDTSTLQVGDLFNMDMSSIVESFPGMAAPNAAIYLGHGEDLLGTDFRKVIRHSFISERPGVYADNPVTAPFDFVTGDITEDDEVDIMDAIALNKYLLGSNKLSWYGSLTADVDKNTVLDSTDSLMILKEVVGITTDFVET